MNRRRYFIASMGLVSLAAMTAPWRSLLEDSSVPLSQTAEDKHSHTSKTGKRKLAHEARDQRYAVSHFDQDLKQDIFLPVAEQPVFQSVLRRQRKIQAHAGYANFSLMSFDEMLKYARSYSVIGEFSADQIRFMEKIFFHDAHDYGFMGEKVISSLTAKVAKKDTVKIPYSGNYLFKGGSQTVFERLRKDVGKNLVLTSGVRSVVKQMYLFLAKAEKCNANLSRASRSLAPPGHSYHALGDFDVGKRNLGALNFTSRFAQTEEYQKLIRLGYVSIRYTQDNYFGVRYEPWHIKIV
ncbi:D-alanyl-D-alanine carboxypeptidase [hydrothermal vent metagenome]|uniref:D-alanyl-D-alanine carboxypeptidase n=1 Tax=hydrothermal vent metagenome TaxID=652676 RepID=A0A3B1BKD8_9ZZZZ